LPSLSILVVVIVVVMMVVPVAVPIVTALVVNIRRPIVPRRHVVSGHILGRNVVIPGRRGHINRTRRFHNYDARQSDSHADGPVGSVRTGCQHRGRHTKSNYSTEGI
jgi:hypothetical protein